MNRYFDDWSSVADVIRDFEEENIVTDAEVLLADYTYCGYDGQAFVLFQRDGTLYEVNGNHCSCFGLEGQWEPEETTWDALRARSFRDLSPEARTAMQALIEAAT